MNTKTGLIEKKSGGRRREWKAYSFTLDYARRSFQYTRPGVGYNMLYNIMMNSLFLIILLAFWKDSTDSIG